MYLHIGKDYVLNIKNVIGIFDIASLRKTNSYESLCSSLNGNIEDISGEKNKTLIITLENNKFKGYISNILSTTISNRLN